MIIDDLFLDEIISMGSDQGLGNLLGIQPYMVPADYASQASFRTRMAGYLDTAQQKGWLNPRSVVVFPEYTGTWLVAAGEAASVYRATSTTQAMLPLALHRPFAFIKHLLAASEHDRTTASIFRLKARQAAEIYQSVFGGLARQYGVTIVAGSLILPDPQVQDGAVLAGRGPLYNVSAVFQPDGRAHPSLVRKAYPISSELPFVCPAQADELPVFDTPAGRLGVLICADSWYPPAYRPLKEGQAEFLAVPSFLSGIDAWERPWGGYDGSPAPPDVDKADAGRLTEGQAWRKYALGGRMHLAGTRCGINVFLHGALWDLGGNSGQSVMIAGEQARETTSKRAALLNLWL
jgi:predicted amidohydrolase